MSTDRGSQPDWERTQRQIESLRRTAAPNITLNRNFPTMSSRAVRKALKRIEAQKALEKEPQIEAPEDADDDDDDVHNSAAPSNPFAMVRTALSMRSHGS